MNRPALMGIVNVTPDSFSGDGQLIRNAVAYAEQLISDGADIVDIGAESTRPGASPLVWEDEWARLEPVLTQVAAAPWRANIRLSVDTRHAFTVARLEDFGVDMINCVGGLRDASMVSMLGNVDGDIVIMHALGIPADPNETLPADDDAIVAILAWKRRMVQRAEIAGIAPERLIFDPGIGFGKTPRQSLALIQRAGELVENGGRWLYGHSRKSFLTLFDAAPAEERDPLTRVFSAMLAQANVPNIRVHDVAGHRAMFDRLCI